jgi:hypothetical protein
MGGGAQMPCQGGGRLCRERLEIKVRGQSGPGSVQSGPGSVPQNEHSDRLAGEGVHVQGVCASARGTGPVFQALTPSDRDGERKGPGPRMGKSLKCCPVPSRITAAPHGMAPV